MSHFQLFTRRYNALRVCLNLNVSFTITGAKHADCARRRMLSDQGRKR